MNDVAFPTKADLIFQLFVSIVIEILQQFMEKRKQHIIKSIILANLFVIASLNIMGYY